LGKLKAIVIAIAVCLHSLTAHAQLFSGKGTGSTDIAVCREYDELAEKVSDLQEKLKKVMDCNNNGQTFDASSDSCRDVIAPAHEWSGTRLRFREPDGSWGASTDLRGPAGSAGPKGSCP